MDSHRNLRVVLLLVVSWWSMLLVHANASFAVSHSLLNQLVANVTSDSTRTTQHSDDIVALLLHDPAAVTALPFVRALSSEQQSELLLQIARTHLFGDDAVPTNITAATQWLEASATGFGDPTAQFLLGALAAANRDASIDANATTATSVLHHHFAALGGSVASSMALGYRYLHGYDVPQSCEHALQHYKFAADRVVRAQSAARPVQLFSAPAPFELSDKCDARLQPAHADEDAHRLEYLQQRARRSSDPRVLENAASVVLFSDHSLPPQHERSNSDARALLERAVQLGSFSAKALLGHVYAYGLGGARQDVEEAARLYREALNESAAVNDTSAEAANGLGLLYLHGSAAATGGVDYERAMQLFEIAVRAGHADGVYNAGMLLTKSRPQRAREYLEAAAAVGHLNAQFQLARLQEQQRFRSASSSLSVARTSCEAIVGSYKTVAENTDVGTELLAQAASAFVLARNTDHALQLYLIAAEMGYAVAESNAAWLLGRQRVRWWQRSRSPDTSSAPYRRLVLRGVAQRSTDAYVRYGDLLYAEHQFVTARKQYERANVQSRSTHGRALFSIAYMHEHALGVPHRSLATAQLYYAQLGKVEPVLRDVAWLLQRKLAIQTSLESMLQRIARAWGRLIHVNARQDGSSSSISHADAVIAAQSTRASPRQQATAARDPAQSDAAASAQTHDTDGVTFASALRFTADSQLLVAAPVLERQFTIDTWLFIDDPQPLDSTDDRKAPAPSTTQMMLLDMQHTFQLKLVRAAAPSDSYVLHFRTAAAQFVFADVPLRTGAWHHIALTAVGSSTQHSAVSLYVDGALRQSFQSPDKAMRLSSHSQQQAETLQTLEGATFMLAVGSSLMRTATVQQATSTAAAQATANFVGSLLHVRVWHVAHAATAIQTLMTTMTTQQLQQQLSTDGSIDAATDLAIELSVDLKRNGKRALSATPEAINARRRTSAPAAAVQSNTHVLRSVSVAVAIVRFPPPQELLQ